MKFFSNSLYFKSLLVLAGLMMCASSMANDAGLSTSEQQNAENSAAPSTESIVDPDAQANKKSFKNPNSLLVATTFKSRNSDGTLRDFAEVAAAYCRAAKHGNADAQYALGWMYANGRGVPKDESVATLLYAKAAEQGHARALESLAETSATSSQSDLPACLLPDPPAPVASTYANDKSKADWNETAAAVYPKNPISKLVDKLAPRYQIDTNLAMAFIAVESGFNARATSQKNAQGLMQLIPTTAERFGVKNAYNAEDNIKGGLAYLQWLLAFFKGDVQLVAAAYNAGERAVEKYKGVPPYPETQNYVQKIAKLYKKSSHPYRDDLVKASTFLTSPKKQTGGTIGF